MQKQTVKADEAGWQWEHPSYRLFAANMQESITTMARNRPWLLWSVTVLVVLIIYLLRHEWHPYLLLMRIYAGAFGIAALLAGAGWFATSIAVSPKLGRYLKPVGALGGIVLVVLGATYGKEWHTYLAQYWRYQTLELTELDRLPTTEHERTWALHGVYTFTRQQMNETEAPARPNLVRVGDAYDWTMGVEPTSPILRFTDSVDEVVSIDSTITSFELRRSKNAHFDTGEKLLFSRNIFTCVRRSFWLWHAFTYEPSNTVLYVRNDQGTWVQAVPLVRWAGYAFPRPEFGGVYIIEQTGGLPWYRKPLEPLKRVFLGCGTWIPPEKVKDNPYLVGQNLVPFEVSRFMAQSIRFQNGLWAPQKWRKEGDIRIPDLPDDVNAQPFTMFFKVRANGQTYPKLYHYFGLEPSDPDKQGLAVSFLAPADGIGPSYAYRHFGRSESLTGVSAVAGLVRASKRSYDWTQNAAVEHRPYIREIPDENGKPDVRFGWLTTVVTIDKQHMTENGDPHGFITGTPEISITDARLKEVIWVDRQRPEKWPGQLREELGGKWAE